MAPQKPMRGAGQEAERQCNVDVPGVVGDGEGADMNDLMIDLETYGLQVDCAIRSIGACFFDVDSDAVGETFYANIDPKTCEDINLYIDPKTKAWWSMQSKAAREALEVDTRPVKEVFESFRRWIITNTVDKTRLQVWSHGLSFDVPIINHTQSLLRLLPVWNYYNERDTRTMLWLAAKKNPAIDPKEPEIALGVPFVGTEHNALDDALHAVRLRQACRELIEDRWHS